MPCNDVTEIVRITLDENERLVEYSLQKLTCGGAVAGRGLIRDWVKHQSVEAILSLSSEDISVVEAADDLSVYLRLKHLFTLQGTLRVYIGRLTDGDEEMIELLAVEHAPEATTLSARVHLNLLTDRIKACGLCGDACRSRLE